MAKTVDHVRVNLILHKKWWFAPAFYAAMFALWLGLISDADSPEHWGGRITADERVGKWLADFAFWVECR
jgi:hypothetical protein